MIKIFEKNKYRIGLAMVMAVLALAAVRMQANLMRVSAQNLPVVVNTNELSFGTVFPGEILEKSFAINYSAEAGDVHYRIVQKRKPLPENHPEYPDGGDPDMPGYYRNLCPSLAKLSLENEGDTESAAALDEEDISDTWVLRFSVPAIFGQVAQDHEGGIVDASGEYGCDISIDVDEDEPVCILGELWRIGDSEASQLDNPVDELNWPGAFGIFPSFADPYIIDSNVYADFPYNSNYSSGYAADFDINFYFNSPVTAQAELVLSWGPGHSGSERKEILLDNVSVGTSPIRNGSFVTGWWEEMERFSDSFTFELNPGSHTLNLKQLTGDGTIWDYAVMNIISCENNDIVETFSISGAGGGGNRLFAADPNNGMTTGGIVVEGEMGAPELSVEKQVLADFANPGDIAVPYRVTVTNNGNISAFNIVLTDNLPQWFIFSDNGVTKKTWLPFELAPGASKNFDYTVDISPSAAAGNYANTVIAVADNNDPVQATAVLNIKTVSVLGALLDATGFSVREFALLIAMIVILLGLSWHIRKNNKAI